jgi:hypothetical protein
MRTKVIEGARLIGCPPSFFSSVEKVEGNGEKEGSLLFWFSFLQMYKV